MMKDEKVVLTWLKLWKKYKVSKDSYGKNRGQEPKGRCTGKD